MTPTLTGITWEHARGFDCLVAAAQAWYETSGVSIQWEQRSLQAFADSPLEELVERHDLLVIDHPHVPRAAEQGLLLPLDDDEHVRQLDDLAEHSVGASHVSYRFAGHQWALATDAAAQVSAYRPDLLDRPPGTWEEVFELAASGRVLWPGKPIDAFSSLLGLTAGAGATAQPAAGDLVSRDDALAALGLLHQLAALVPAQCLELNPIEVAERLAKGHRWAYAPMLFGYSNYSRERYRRHRLRYINAPTTRPGQIGSLLGGAGIAASARTRHPQLAKDFAFWVAQESTQTGVYFDAGGQPGHSRAWDNDRLNAASLDFFTGTRPTLEAAYLRPQSPGYLAFQDTFSRKVTACLQGQIGDDELITELLERTRSFASTRSQT